LPSRRLERLRSSETTIPADSHSNLSPWLASRFRYRIHRPCHHTCQTACWNWLSRLRKPHLMRMFAILSKASNEQHVILLQVSQSSTTSSAYSRMGSDVASAMIFLRDNVLLESQLQFDHIKPRLLGNWPPSGSPAIKYQQSVLTICINRHLGHWGTCPGLILVWSHLDLLIRNHDLDMIHVIGPGHGAPAALAALWLEGSLEKFYPGEYDRNAAGLRNLITRFSVPGGFPR